MDLVLSELRWSTCLVYLDDINVYSRTAEEPVRRLQSVFECLKGGNLKVRVKKCLLAQAKLHALGHVVDKAGIAPNPEKISVVQEFPRPPSIATRAQKI